jgi:photosystem II stability/assembly factor-like uncharacterized protein
VGDSGTILRTIDGGTDWTSISSGTIKDLNSVTFSSSGKGFAVGDGGIVLSSTDGGITWTSNTPCPEENLYSVKFPTVDTGFGVGDIGLVIKTLDGGSTWYCLTPLIIAPLYSAYFVTADVGYIVGAGTTSDSSKGFIFKANDWSPIFLSENHTGLYSVFFPDADTGYAVGEYSTIIKTTDSGTTWNLLSHDSGYFFSSVWFTNPHTGYLVGSGGLIKKTVDGGLNWIVSPSGITQLLQNVYFLNADTGYAVGDSGIILKTKDGGVISSVDNISAKPAFTVYPNPAKDKCRVECVKCNIKNIEIFNLTGEKVYGAEFPAGAGDAVEVYLNFPVGVYFVRVTDDKAVEVGKFIKQ